MKAVVTAGEGDLWMEERPRPAPDENEVLVRIHAVGICGSDVGLRYGEGPPWTNYPLVPGHEVCGEVVELGSDVHESGFDVGDRVALHGFVSCGTCTACREGRYHQCDTLREIGFTLDGGYREYAAVPAYTLVPIPDGVSDAEATQIDSAGCTYRGIKQVAPSVTDTVAVLGPGSLGLFGVQLLRARGVADVVLTGTRDERLAAGEKLGATATVNVRETDPVAFLDDYTDGEGVDLCVETAGAGDVVDTCLSATKRGGDVVLTGVFGESKELDPNDIVAKELTVHGSVTAAHAVDEVLALFERGALTVDGVVTHEFDLENYEDAFDVVQNRRNGVIKAILRP